jgi:glycosyltransferase involved in cell wall biosynthesis
VKLAVVVQRYGQTINGGAELHARYIAERLARHADVEVLTTRAQDYVTWRNQLPQGVETVNGIPVRRFPVTQERDPTDFGIRSAHVFGATHSLAEELRWLDAEGPRCPALIEYLVTHADDYDLCFVFSYRYYHAYHAARALPDKVVLVPTAERDPAAGLSMFGPMFRGVRALMYNSPEERAMIQTIARNHDVPSVVVGIGSELPSETQPQRFRQKYDVHGPFAIYVGRIDENKGCRELFDYFSTYVREGDGRLSLVLVGHPLLPIPTHPRIRHLGFLDDADKFDAIAAADVLIVPSYFESLSMVALEAWGLGRPVLANGHCDVLRGQCLRSHAGLYYDTRQEFVETLRAIERIKWLNVTLGRNGRQFYRTHYDWPVIDRKYFDMIARLQASAGNASGTRGPSWLERRQPTCRPAAEIVDAIPRGPARTVAEDDRNRARSEGHIQPAAPESSIGLAANGAQTGDPPTTGPSTRASSGEARPVPQPPPALPSAAPPASRAQGRSSRPFSKRGRHRPGGKGGRT